MSKRTAKPSHKQRSALHRSQNTRQTEAGRAFLRLPHPHVSIAPNVAQVPRGTVADAPSQTGQQPPGGYDLLGFQAGFPSSGLVTEPHTAASPNLRKPVLQCQPTSWAAAAAPSTPPRPSLPVLAAGLHAHLLRVQPVVLQA